MKNVKRLFSLMLAIMMIAMMVVPTGAATRTINKMGTIRIAGVEDGHTYKLYRLLDLYEFNPYSTPAAHGDGAYIYTLRDPNDKQNETKPLAASMWNAFISTVEDDKLTPPQKYFKVSDQNAQKGNEIIPLKVVTWVSELPNVQDDRTTLNERAADLSEKAKAYVDSNPSLPADASIDAKKDDTIHPADVLVNEPYIEFDNLPLGYYLVVSTVGALCALTTNDIEITVGNKNEVPVIDKSVKEDDATVPGREWVDKNDADIGQVVEFKTIIKKKAGATNFVVHDKMTDGLTFDEDSVSITYVDPKTNEVKKIETGYAVSIPITDPDSSPCSLPNDQDSGHCTFHVVFDNSCLNALPVECDITLMYSATLNNNANVGDDGEINKTLLAYGDNHYTAWDSTITNTWKFNIFKYRLSGSTPVPLDGAGFTIYRTYANGTFSDPIEFVNMNKKTIVEGEKQAPYYRPKAADEDSETVTVYTQLETDLYTDTQTNPDMSKHNGSLHIFGLDSGKYYIVETKVPAGFTQAPWYEVTISNVGTVEFKKQGAGDALTDNMNVAIQILNETSPILPETGGIGTTIFYVAGSIMVVGAVLFLVTKRRMRFDAE